MFQSMNIKIQDRYGAGCQKCVCLRTDHEFSSKFVDLIRASSGDPVWMSLFDV